MSGLALNPARFEGRVALVTGGGAGIGGAVATRLSREGARVIIWDIDEGRMAAIAETLGRQALVRKVDVTDAAAIEQAMAEAISTFGRLDILVNAAGIVGPVGPFWQADEAAFERVMTLNVMGTFLASRAAVPAMIAQRWGRIVNLASVTANEGPKDLAPYAASKAAVVGLTKSMGKDLATSGVLVNAVTPALIATELLNQLTPEYLKAATARIPLGRPGTLDEVAALVTWLCSEECSFSTGAAFDLSGGRGL